MRVAAIDVGTNTTRLLVAETARTYGRYHDLSRRLMFTRLGQGVDSAGKINEEAMKRTLDAIGAYAAECGEFGVERLRLGTTSAVRDASNRDEFLGAAKRLAGVEPEVLEGSKEAELSFEGAVSDLEPGKYLVCDIGGGSTEFFLGSTLQGDGMKSGGISLDIGSVRLTERVISHDPPTGDELERLAEEVKTALDKARRAIPDVSSAKLVGVAGTVTTLASLHLGLLDYDPSKTHHLRLAASDVRELYSKLSRMTIKSRRELKAMPAGRADVIVAGAAIFELVMSAWSFDQAIVSERDILDGLVLGLLGRHD